MSSKFIISKKPSVQTKNGKKLNTTVIKAKSENNLIKYSEITKFMKALENTTDTNKIRIFGANRLKTAMTIKSEGAIFDPDYMSNKPKNISDKLDGYYEVHFISVD